jgi:hypothetical protein
MNKWVLTGGYWPEIREMDCIPDGEFKGRQLYRIPKIHKRLMMQDEEVFDTEIAAARYALHMLDRKVNSLNEYRHKMQGIISDQLESAEHWEAPL